MSESLLQEAQKIQDELISWRRQLHQIPEIGTSLPQTVKFVTSHLDDMGISYYVMEDSSNVVATVGSGKTCFLLRSDMDALPVPEESGVDFASGNGCMHGCGHDMHAAILLGAARLLKNHEAELNGTVKLLFQSGEETFNGAKAAIAGGVLENPHVDAAFAMHVFASVDKDIILYDSNPMAAVYGFKITLTGHGGHGSQPENCIDPINAGVQVYLALQALIARECPPYEEAALTIGQFSAGNAANVIPERAVLQGTLRTFKKSVNELIIRRINEIVPAVAAAYRCQAEIEVLSSVPSVVCDDELNEEFIASIREVAPQITASKNLHVMGSEDFACISDLVPSSYFIIGAGVEDRSKWVGQHNPKIVFNEDTLAVGAACYAKVAMGWLAKHGEK